VACSEQELTTRILRRVEDGRDFNFDLWDALQSMFTAQPTHKIKLDAIVRAAAAASARPPACVRRAGFCRAQAQATCAVGSASRSERPPTTLPEPQFKRAPCGHTSGVTSNGHLRCDQQRPTSPPVPPCSTERPRTARTRLNLTAAPSSLTQPLTMVHMSHAPARVVSLHAFTHLSAHTSIDCG